MFNGNSRKSSRGVPGVILEIISQEISKGITPRIVFDELR